MQTKVRSPSQDNGQMQSFYTRPSEDCFLHPKQDICILAWTKWLNTKNWIWRPKSVSVCSLPVFFSLPTQLHLSISELNFPLEVTALLTCLEAAKTRLNVLSLTASPVLSVFTPVPGLDRSAVQPFELWSAEAEHTIKGSQDLRALSMNSPGLNRNNSNMYRISHSAHNGMQCE